MKGEGDAGPIYTNSGFREIKKVEQLRYVVGYRPRLDGCIIFKMNLQTKVCMVILVC